MVQIYGTLGPACADRDILEEMFRAGMTGMRLNLSHTGLRESKRLVTNFREAAKNAGVLPGLLIDMQGPELRVGHLEPSVTLREGETALLVSAKETERKQGSIPVPWEVIEVLEPGMRLLFDDGRIEVTVGEKTQVGTQVTVTRGGVLTSHKSVKIVGRQVEMPVLTAHDVENLKLAADYGVTGLMQPFVRSGRDLSAVREQLLKYHAEHVKIFAKIENQDAVSELESIVREADVIVIARGDLGNDMELWELPAVQKDISKVCSKAGKPFVVVTQMLKSMEENPVPTRAEVSDIFNAVADGAYGVMVTGETAVGKYPVEVIRYLANTAYSAERWREQKRRG